MNTSDEKAALREQYRRLRLENKENVSFNKVLDIPEIASSKIIASYFSYGSEPNTNEINKKLIALGIRVLLPRINGTELEWRFWDGNLAEVEKKSGIFEPTGEIFTNYSHIDSLILPALAIDHTGNRLGKGKGFYDRALTSISAFTIALIYSNEYSSTVLPSDSFDIKVKAALTPEKLYRFS
jgi:5-formyltetrahydrofolate cyclo-ligase